MNTDRDPKDSATHRALRLAERNFRIPDSNRGSAGLRACRRRAVPVRSASTRPDMVLPAECQVETTATSTLAHVQQFAVASTTETTETLAGRADVQ